MNTHRNVDMLNTRNIFLSFKTPNTEYVYCLKLITIKKILLKLLFKIIFHYFHVQHTHNKPGQICYCLCYYGYERGSAFLFATGSTAKMKYFTQN